MPQYTTPVEQALGVPVRQGKHGMEVTVPARGLIVVSWSEIDAMRQCPMKHDLSYIERWSKPPRPDGALGKGILWHEVMEDHYRALVATQGKAPGDKPTESEPARLALAEAAGRLRLAKYKAEAVRRHDSGALETHDLIEWMYDGYIEMWGSDPQWWIAATEHNAQVRLPNLTGGKSRFALKLKIDLVIAQQGMFDNKLGKRSWHTYVVDHKSGKDLPKDTDFDFLDQFTLYTWALRQVGKKVYGQMYNAARTYRTIKPAALDTRFERTPMARVDTELDRVAIEAYQDVKARYDQQRALDKVGGEPPRHTNEKTCGWRCDFTEPCLHGRKGGDMRDFLYSSGFRQAFERH